MNTRELIFIESRRKAFNAAQVKNVLLYNIVYHKFFLNNNRTRFDYEHIAVESVWDNIDDG